MSRGTAAPACRPDSIAPSMKPDHPFARSEPASSTRPSGRRISSWWSAYQPGRWIAQVPRENSSASQSCAIAPVAVVAGQDRVELPLDQGEVAMVAAGVVGPEADQDLASVAELLLGVEVPEGMLAAQHGERLRRTGDADEQLDPAGRLAERDGGALALRERRLERQVAERVQRDRDDDAARPEQLARARLDRHVVVVPGDRRDGRREPPLERRARGDRGEQRPGPVGERRPPAGELRERQAVAGERVPAEHRHGARLVERRVGQRLELGVQHLVLLVREVELRHPLGDREAVEAREPVAPEQRVVRLRQRVVDAVDERSQPRAAIASRSLAAPSRRSSPTYQAERSARVLSSTRSPARVISDHVWG